jgi:PAS domain S-box-containing protein
VKETLRKIRSWLIDGVPTDYISKESLVHYRYLLILGGIGRASYNILLFVLNGYSIPQSFGLGEYLFLNLGLNLVLVGAGISTIYSPWARKNIYLIVQMCMWLTSLAIMHSCYKTNLQINYVIGAFIFISICYHVLVSKGAVSFYSFLILIGVCFAPSHELTSNTVSKSVFVMGGFLCVIFGFIAVVEKKRIIKALTDSKSIVRQAVEATGVATWSLDLKSGTVSGSPQYFAHIGLPEDTKTIPNDTVLKNHIHPDDFEMLTIVTNRSIETGICEPVQYRLLHPDGKIIWVEGRASAQKNSAGVSTHFVGTTTDITEKKLAEFKERHTRETLELALATGNMGAWDWNLKDQSSEWSDTKYDMIGVEHGSDINAEYISKMHEEDRERVLAKFHTAASEGVGLSVEGRMHHPTKGIRWIKEIATVYKDKNGIPARMIGVTTDITEEKIREETILKSSAVLQETQMLAQVGSWERNMERDELEFSEVAQSLYGVSKSVVPRNEIIALMHPEDADILRTVTSEFVEKRINYDIKHRIIINGEVRHMRIVGRPIMKDGNLVKYIGSVQDVTKEVLMLESAKAQSEIFTMTLKAANLAHWEWNPKANILTFDQEWFQQINVLGDDTRLETWMAALHPDDIVPVGEKIQAHMEGKTDIYEAVMRLKAKTGDYKHVLAKGKIIQRDKEGNATRFTGVHVDLTEMMELKAQVEEQKSQLIHSAQLSALGEMAAGVAHEIFNPVAGIKVRTQLIKRSLERGKIPTDLVHSMDEIITDVNRCTSIISGLKLLSRDDSSLPSQEFDVADIVSQTISLCRTKATSRGVKIDILGAGLSLGIYGVPTMVSQVLLNIVSNAVDATELVPADLDQRWVKIEMKKEKGFAVVSISDSGPGIPTEMANKIFQPFFTTKEIGKGTGLGLSISKSIIEKHGGSLILDQSKDDTTFVLRFKLSTKEAKTA